MNLNRTRGTKIDMEETRNLESSEQSIEQWRSRATRILLIVIAALTAPRVAMVLLQWPTSFTLAARVTMATLFAALLVVTFAPRVGKQTRIWSLAVVSCALGAYQLIRGGLAGDGRLTLITLPMFVLAMAGARAAWIVMGICAAIYSAVAVGMNRGYFSGMLIIQDNPTKLERWVILGVCAAAHAVVLAAVIAALLAVYRRSLQLEHRTANLLREEAVQRTAALEALERESRERTRLEASLLNAGEEERRLMGAEVHDGLCQQLTAAMLHCMAGEQRGGAEQMRAAEDMRAARQILQECLDEAYALVHRLAPLRMSGKDLSLALSRLAKQTELSARIQCVYREEGQTPQIAPEAGAHLYRIAQEAVRNAVRHAQASTLNIELAASDEAIELRIEDDGIGIGEVAPGSGLGMKTMRYRSELIGALLTISPGDDGGTALRCRMAWDKTRAGDGENGPATLDSPKHEPAIVPD